MKSMVTVAIFGHAPRRETNVRLDRGAQHTEDLTVVLSSTI